MYEGTIAGGMFKVAPLGNHVPSGRYQHLVPSRKCASSFLRGGQYRGTSLIRPTSPPPLGTPYVPRYGPTVGSCGVAVSHKRGNPVIDTRFLLTAHARAINAVSLTNPVLYRGPSLIRNFNPPRTTTEP